MSIFDMFKKDVDEVAEEAAETAIESGFSDTKLEDSKEPTVDTSEEEEDDSLGSWLKRGRNKTKGFFGSLGLKSAKNHNNIAAQEDVYDEYKDELESMGFKAPKQNIFGKALGVIGDLGTPFSMMADRKKQEEAGTDTLDTSFMQNIGFNDTIETLSLAVGTEADQTSLTYIYNMAERQTEQLVDAVNSGQISLEDARKMVGEMEESMSDEFKIQLDRYDILDMPEKFTFDNMGTIVKAGNAFNTKFDERQSSEKYTSLETAVKELKGKDDAEKYLELAGMEENATKISDTVGAEMQKMFNERGEKRDPNAMWEGQKFDDTHVKWIVQNFHKEMQNKNYKYSSSMADLYEQKVWAEENGKDGLANQMQIGIDKIKDMRDQQTEAYLEFYTYFINNIGKKGHQSLSQMEYQYEKNTNNEVEAMTFYKGEDSKNRVSIKGRVSEIVHARMFEATGMRAIQERKNVVEGMFNVGKSISQGNFKEALGYAGGVLKDKLDVVVEDYRTIVNGLSFGTSVIGARVIQPVLTRTLAGIVNVFDPGANEGYKMAEEDIEKGIIASHDQKRKGSHFTLGGNKRFLVDLERPLPGADMYYKGAAALQDAGPMVIQVVGEMLLTRKVMNPTKFLKGARWVDDIDDIPNATKFVTQSADLMSDGVRGVKTQKGITDAFKKGYNFTQNGMRNKTFTQKMNKYAAARMVEQTIVMDSIFNAGRTDAMSKGEVGISLLFAGTLDLMDVMKEMKQFKTLGDVDMLTKLATNEEYVERLAKQIYGVTDEGWAKSSVEQKNIYKADARGYNNMIMEQLYNIKNKVPAKSFKEMTDMLGEMAGASPEISKRIAHEGANTVDEFYKSMGKLQNDMVKLTREQAITENTEKVMAGFTKEADGSLSYGREQFYLEPKSGHFMRFFVNNIAPQGADQSILRTASKFKVGEQEFKILSVSDLKVSPRGVEYMPFKLEMPDKTIVEGSFYKARGSENFNIGFGARNKIGEIDPDKLAQVKKIFGIETLDEKSLERISLPKDVRVFYSPATKEVAEGVAAEVTEKVVKEAVVSDKKLYKVASTSVRDKIKLIKKEIAQLKKKKSQIVADANDGITDIIDDAAVLISKAEDDILDAMILLEKREGLVLVNKQIETKTLLRKKLKAEIKQLRVEAKQAILAADKKILKEQLGGLSDSWKRLNDEVNNLHAQRLDLMRIDKEALTKNIKSLEADKKFYEELQGLVEKTKPGTRAEFDKITNKLTRVNELLESYKTNPKSQIHIDLTESLETSFGGFTSRTNPVPKENYSKLADIMIANDANMDSFLKALNGSDVHPSIKGYFNDMARSGDYTIAAAGKKNLYEKLYQRGIKNQLNDMATTSEFKKVVNSFGQKEIREAVDIYFSGGWKKMPGFRGKLKAAGIDVSKNITDKELATMFDTLVNGLVKTPSGESKTIKELFAEKTIREYELLEASAEGVVTAPLKAKKESWNVLKKNLITLKKDIEFQGNIKKLMDAKNPYLFINHPDNVLFKEKYIQYQKSQTIVNDILDDPSVRDAITYKDFKEDGPGSLADALMREIYDEIGIKYTKDANFMKKDLDGKIVEVAGDIRGLGEHRLMVEDAYLRGKDLMDNYGQFLPTDEKAFLKKLLSENRSRYRTINMDREAKLMKEGLEVEAAEKMVAAEGDEIAEAVVKETLDEEIERVGAELTTHKTVLGMTEDEVAPTMKYLNGYSTQVGRVVLPQSKDFIGDSYFRHSDTYRNIMNKHGKLPDGTSLSSMFDKGMRWNKKKIRENERFMEDLEQFAKNQSFDPIRFKNIEYLNKVKSAHKQLLAMYEEMGEVLGKRYGDAFAQNIKDYTKELTTDKMNKMGQMFVHGDWMEGIRYTNPDTYRLIQNDLEMSNKLRGLPGTMPKIEGRQYRAKRVYAINTLAHDSLSDAQAAIIGGAANATRRRNLAKNTKFQKVKNKLGQMMNLPTYVFSQTILHGSQGLLLLVMNAQAIAVDVFTDSTRHFTKKGMSGIRKKYNLLIDPMDYDQAAGGFFRQLFDGEIKGLKDAGLTAAKKIGDTVNQAGRLGIYNLAEITLDSNFRNSAIRRSIWDVTSTSTEAEFEAYMKKAVKDGTDSDILQAIRNRAENHYVLRNANNINMAEGKFLYGNPYTILGRAKKTLGWAYHFLGAWGNQHMRNYFKMLGNGRADVNKIYGELLAQVGKKEADKHIRRFVMNNKDIDMTMMKLVAAMSIGDKINRVEKDRDEEPGFLESISDAAKIGMNFYAGSQGLMSSPVGRNIMNFVEGLFLDNGVEHTDLPDLMVGAARLFEGALGNMSRRTLGFNSMASALGTINASDEDDITAADFVQERWKAFTSGTEGYTHFMSNDIIDGSYNQKLPMSTAGEMEMFFPDFADIREGYQKLNTIERMAKLDQKIKDNGVKALFEWSIYKYPLVKNYMFGQFKTSTDVDVVIDDYNRLPEAWNLAHGKLNIAPGDYNYSEYVFSRLVELAPHFNRKDKIVESTPADPSKDQEYVPVNIRYKDGEAVSQWYNDFRMKYISKKGNIIRDKQNKEDLFVKSFFDAMGEKKMSSYLDEFQKEDNDQVKAGMRLLGAIESMGNDADVPGAARTLVAAIVQDRYRELYGAARKEAGFERDDVPERWTKEIEPILKQKIVSEFGETLYVTDKESWTDVALYYARENLPQHRHRFSGGDITENSVDEDGESTFWKKTYYPVGMTYETNGYQDSKARQFFKADLFANIEAYAGNHNAADYLNGLASMYMPSNSKEASDPAWQRLMMKGVLDQVDFIDSTNLSDQDKLNLHVGTALFLSSNLSTIRNNPGVEEAIGKDVVDDVEQFIRSSGNKTLKIEEDIVNMDGAKMAAEGERIAFEDLQKGGADNYNNTGTLLDKYDKDGKYRSSLFAKDAKKNYKKNKPYYNNLRFYLQKQSWKPSNYGYSKSSGSKYWNDPLSNFYKYYFYYKDAKSGGISVGGRGKKIARNFRTKRTKIYVPKTKPKK